MDESYQELVCDPERQAWKTQSGLTVARAVAIYASNKPKNYLGILSKQRENVRSR